MLSSGTGVIRSDEEISGSIAGVSNGTSVPSSAGHEGKVSLSL